MPIILCFTNFKIVIHFDVLHCWLWKSTGLSKCQLSCARSFRVSEALSRGKYYPVTSPETFPSISWLKSVIFKSQDHFPDLQAAATRS